VGEAKAQGRTAQYKNHGQQHMSSLKIHLWFTHDFLRRSVEYFTSQSLQMLKA